MTKLFWKILFSWVSWHARRLNHTGDNVWYSVKSILLLKAQGLLETFLVPSGFSHEALKLTRTLILCYRLHIKNCFVIPQVFNAMVTQHFNTILSSGRRYKAVSMCYTLLRMRIYVWGTQPWTFWCRKPKDIARNNIHSKKKRGMHIASFSCKTSLQTHVDHCILSMYASSLIF